MLGSVRFEFGSDLPDDNLNFLYSFRKQAPQVAFGTIERVPQIMNMSTQHEIVLHPHQTIKDQIIVATQP